MTPWRQVTDVAPETTLMESLRSMEASRSPYASVRDRAGNVIGILSQEQIAIRIQTAAQA